MNRKHRHIKGDGSWWLCDARGIEVARVCEECVDEVKKEYRSDIFEDPNYWHDEPIEDD